MKLIKPKVTDFENVLEDYFSFHSANYVRNPRLFNYEMKVMKKANDSYDFWVKANIPTSSMGDLVLPYHLDGFSREVVVSRKGERLIKAYERLLVNERKVSERRIPRFYIKVMSLKDIIRDSGAKSFLFSQGPFFEFGEDYEQSVFGEQDLVHLDGFNRLFALMDLKESERPGSIESYIACKENFFEVFEDE